MLEMSSDETEYNIRVERLAVKTLCAADVLKNAVKTAGELSALHKKVGRYMRQAKLILTWKQKTGAIKMVGAAAKTIGTAMVLAAPLHPKLGLAVKVGHKLYKFGAGLKALNAIGGMLRELWQSGCRKAVVDFTHGSALLTRNLSVFKEVVEDLQRSAQSLRTNDFQSPEEVINLLGQFIPPDLLNYAVHVINLAFGGQNYSPLFDLMALSSDPLNSSDFVQVMREIESFHFTEFVEQGDCKSLVAIISFLHIGRELLDFLDGFKRVTEKDCHFLHECLTKFTEESTTVLRVVSFLTHVNQDRSRLQGLSKTDSANGLNLSSSPENKAVQNDNFTDHDVSVGGVNISELPSVLTKTDNENVEKIETEAVPCLTAATEVTEQSGFVQASRMRIVNTVMSLSLMINSGSALMTSAAKNIVGRESSVAKTSRCLQANSSFNRL